MICDLVLLFLHGLIGVERRGRKGNTQLNNMSMCSLLEPDSPFFFLEKGRARDALPT